MAGTQSVGQLTSLPGVASGIPTALVPTAVPDWLDRVKNAKTPFLNAITKGSAPSRMTPKLTWGWSSNRIMFDQLNGAYASGTTITVDNQSRFQVGDFIKIEGEIMRVTAYVSTNQLTVQTAQGGTANGAHPDNSGILILGPSFLQNQDTTLTPIIQGELLTNEWQQIEYMLTASQMRQAFDSFENSGKGDALTYFSKKLMNIEGPVNAERMLINNLAQAQSGVLAGMFGGALQPAFTANRVSVPGTAITAKIVMDALEAGQLQSDEAVDLTVVGHPRTLRRLSAQFNSLRQMTATDDTVKLNFEKFITPQGTLTFMPTRQWVQPGTVDGVPEKELNSVLICNPKDFVLRPAPDSAWTLDYRDNPYNTAWQKISYLRGIYSLEAQNIYTRSYIYGFSTLDSDYPNMI